MNTIDIHDGMIANLEWEAKHAAKLDHIYETERNRFISDSFNNSQQNSNNGSIGVKMSMIENRLDMIESRINSLHEMFVGQVESGGLFVFAPNQNVRANMAFTLTDEQFKQLIESIINK